MIGHALAKELANLEGLNHGNYVMGAGKEVAPAMRGGAIRLPRGSSGSSPDPFWP